MITPFENDGCQYFTLHNADPELLASAVAARLDFFKKYRADGEIRFAVTSFLLPDGRMITAVQSIPHVPLLWEVSTFLEAKNAKLH